MSDALYDNTVYVAGSTAGHFTATSRHDPEQDVHICASVVVRHNLVPGQRAVDALKIRISKSY